MMSDKELLYQLISRKVEDILVGINPSLRIISDMTTKYIISYIDPYVSAFLANENELNTDVASAFVKQEINEKVNNFIREFNKEKDGNNL